VDAGAQALPSQNTPTVQSINQGFLKTGQDRRQQCLCIPASLNAQAEVLLLQALLSSQGMCTTTDNWAS
jgi:hypothetical protein